MSKASWQTEDPVQSWAEDRFGPSLVRRAQKRQIHPTIGGWLVVGDVHLGDAYADYQVERVDGRYRCSCQGHLYGDSRSRICSHALAVMLYVKHHPATVAVQPVAAVPQPVPEPVQPAIPSPQDVRFGYPPFPAKFTAFHPHQWTAIEEVVAAFESGKKVVIVDAPTGCHAAGTMILMADGYEMVRGDCRLLVR